MSPAMMLDNLGQHFDLLVWMLVWVSWMFNQFHNWHHFFESTLDFHVSNSSLKPEKKK
jgi:hypothetical protein